jgi:hypothetical protein
MRVDSTPKPECLRLDQSAMLALNTSAIDIMREPGAQAGNTLSRRSGESVV